MAAILIAEDDEALRTFLARALEEADHRVKGVGSGEDALPHLADIDVLVTDIVMSGMTGVTLAEKAIDRHPHLQVIFITGFSAVALERRQDELGTAPVLAKPFHLKQLVDQIDRLLSKSHKPVA